MFGKNLLNLLKAVYPLGGSLRALKTGRARGFGLDPDEEGRCLQGDSLWNTSGIEKIFDDVEDDVYGDGVCLALTVSQ